ncbi:TonB-dependent receptor [Fulvivirga sp. M361]|nr:TonB-dependent receptor [Fulvivirga sp. M361]
MSKFLFYVVFLQTLFASLLHAGESKGQQKSLYEVKVRIGPGTQHVLHIFREIERETDFVFSYNDKYVRNAEVFVGTYQTLGELLEEISRNADLQFRRINENIHVDRKKPSQTHVSEVYEKYQDIEISGQVVDETGEGLPGAAVSILGTNKGTITDVEGRFSLMAEPGSTLIVSFVGYISQKIQITDQTVLNISLELDIQSLQEIVVIGYQGVKKKDLTGSTAIIKPGVSNRVTTNSLAESLQGLAPGVTVRNGGSPGQQSVIEIRGVASFADTNPLYVIDGMLADANPTINNNDIESIQILKDASAAAIYGSRAANGVIIITTKKGKVGPMQVSFTGKRGIQQIPNTWDVMNAEEFAAMQRAQYENSGRTPPALVDVDFNPEIDTDWQEEMIRTGTMQDYNLSISGGSETSSYLVSGSYYDNQGILKGRDFERYSFRLNSESKIGRVTFGENLLFTHTRNQTPGEGNPFYDMPQLLPVIPVQNADYISDTNPEGWGIGSVNAPSYAWNPVAILNLSHQDNNFSKLVGNAYLNVKLADWISYRFNVGLEASFDHIKSVREDGVWSFNAAVFPSYVDDYRSTYLSKLFEHTININKDLGDHSINAVLGISQQSNQRDFTSARRSELQQFNGQYLNTINSAIGDDVAAGGRPEDNFILGYLGRINYIYADKYLLTLTGRIDQNSRFSEDYRTGYFPSVAVGWRLSEESFFDVSFISNLKLTASYGRLGVIPGIVGSWDHIGRLNSNARAIFGPDQEAYVGAYQARISNTQLQWETRITQNIGLEAGLFSNQLLFGIEFYNSLSDDAILQLPLPRYLGNLNGDPFVNAGSIRNKGVEVSASYRKREGELKWEVSGNFTTIENTIESVGNQGEGIDYLQTGLTRSKVGRPVAEWFLLKTDGIFQSEQEVLDHTNSDGVIIQGNARPGDIRFVDVNDDGQITEADRDYSGKSPWPTLQAGAQFNAEYKNFTLNLQMVAVFGNYIYNGTRQILDGYQNTNFRKDIQPWTEENPNTGDPRIGVAEGDVALSQNAGNSTRWLENGSYFRIRNLEIGYNFNEELLGTTGIENARVFISGQNLMTITNYSGLDPDVVGTGILERGFDSGNWPSSRVYSIGVQFQF